MHIIETRTRLAKKEVKRLENGSLRMFWTIASSQNTSKGILQLRVLKDW